MFLLNSMNIFSQKGFNKNMINEKEKKSFFYIVNYIKLYFVLINF